MRAEVAAGGSEGAAGGGGAAAAVLQGRGPVALQRSQELCDYGAWGEWSACTKPCGGGTAMRKRKQLGLLAEFFYLAEPATQLPDLSLLTPDLVRSDREVDYEDVSAAWLGLNRRDNFAARWSGELLIVKPGEYMLTLTSHDGSKLELGGKPLVLNDGLHPGPRPASMVKKSAKVNLTAGAHPLVVNFFENSGFAGVILKYRGPDSGEQDIVIPPNSLEHFNKECSADSEEAHECNTDICSADCKWGDWAPYSPCSKSCGDGTTWRIRDMVVLQGGFGRPCDGPDTESKVCNEQGCPCATNDCDTSG